MSTTTQLAVYENNIWFAATESRGFYHVHLADGQETAVATRIAPRSNPAGAGPVAFAPDEHLLAAIGWVFPDPPPLEGAELRAALLNIVRGRRDRLLLFDVKGGVGDLAGIELPTAGAPQVCSIAFFNGRLWLAAGFFEVAFRLGPGAESMLCTYSMEEQRFTAPEIRGAGSVDFLTGLTRDYSPTLVAGLGGLCIHSKAQRRLGIYRGDSFEVVPGAWPEARVVVAGACADGSISFLSTDRPGGQLRLMRRPGEFEIVAEWSDVPWLGVQSLAITANGAAFVQGIGGDLHYLPCGSDHWQTVKVPRWPEDMVRIIAERGGRS
jgi:hypothetical protein